MLRVCILRNRAIRAALYARKAGVREEAWERWRHADPNLPRSIRRYAGLPGFVPRSLFSPPAAPPSRGVPAGLSIPKMKKEYNRVCVRRARSPLFRRLNLDLPRSRAPADFAALF